MTYLSIFNHSGIEREYEQKLMPDGRFSVDGFVLVYDVSMVPNRSPEKQTEFCAQVLSNIMKCRPQKPCVIAATKCDEANEILVRELERLVNRKGEIFLIKLIDSKLSLRLKSLLHYPY